MRTSCPPCLLVLLIACASTKPSGTTDDDSDAKAGDSATADDSGSAPEDSGEADDTGEPDPGESATLTAGPAIACADPEARDIAPLTTPDFGPDWAAQTPTVDSTDPLAAGGMTVADLTGDGRVDIYLPQVGADQLYIGQPDGTLTDESDARLDTDGIPDASAASAVDIEGDGDLDLFVPTATGQNRLLINDGTGHFTDGTEAAGLSGQGWPGAQGVFGDMDGDGDLDLFVVTFRNCDPSIATDPDNPWSDTPQALWENQGDGSFVDVSDRMADHPGIGGRMRAASWIDLDNDLDLDLHIVSDRGFSSDCTVNNLVYRNEDALFTHAAEEMALGIRMEGMGLGIGDLNHDGLPDFAMSDMQRIWMVESEISGTWYDSTLVRGLDFDPVRRDRWSGWGTELADLDNDGDLDLYVSFGGSPDVPPATMNPMNQPDMLYLQEATGLFTEVSTEWGIDDAANNRAVLAVDINGDGWLDLGRRTIHGDAAFALSRCGEAAWLKVALQMPGPNPRGVGAIIRARVGEHTQMRWLTAGATGLQSSTEPTAHFGLGTAESVDLLEVQWPDGSVSSFTDVGTRRHVTVARTGK